MPLCRVSRIQHDGLIVDLHISGGIFIHTKLNYSRGSSSLNNKPYKPIKQNNNGNRKLLQFQYWKNNLKNSYQISPTKNLMSMCVCGTHICNIQQHGASLIIFYMHNGTTKHFLFHKKYPNPNTDHYKLINQGKSESVTFRWQCKH